ncbi:FmdB family zinc ribbon protein [Desulfoferula mesophila]|uniref:Putative regulatory protein FmdB zinc ribbon domain-containing protein n=1 Tax=Desulfoferula mesophila TaxID=3058419 RepID=A0AAU9F4G5_9BACT|nr:hypothetical protein FAK_30530 [Desulfoferula mesophilus]
MPLYSFSCNNCGQEVDLFLSLGELNRGVAQCPYCQSRDLKGPGQDQMAAAGASPSPAGSRPSCVIGQK